MKKKETAGTTEETSWIHKCSVWKNDSTPGKPYEKGLNLANSGEGVSHYSQITQFRRENTPTPSMGGPVQGDRDNLCLVTEFPPAQGVEAPSASLGKKKESKGKARESFCIDLRVPGLHHERGMLIYLSTGGPHLPSGGPRCAPTHLKENDIDEWGGTFDARVISSLD